MVFLDIFLKRYEIYDDQYIKKESTKRYCDLFLMFLTSNDTYESARKDEYVLKYKRFVPTLLLSKNSDISIKKRVRYLLAYISPAFYHLVSANRNK